MHKMTNDPNQQVRTSLRITWGWVLLVALYLFIVNKETRPPFGGHRSRHMERSFHAYIINKHYNAKH